MKILHSARHLGRALVALFILSIAGYAANAQTITVLSPDGGEAFTSGSKIPILWTGNTTSAVTIEYSTDSGATWQLIAQHINGGRYLWDVPPVSMDIESWLVRVTMEGSATLQEYRRFTGSGTSNAVEFSNDGRFLASAGGNDHTLNIWDIATSQKVHTMTLPSSIGWIEFSPDDQELAVCSHNKNAFVFNTTTGAQIKELAVSGGSSWSARYNDAGTKLATGQLNGTMTVWDRTTWLPDYTVTPHTGIVRCAEFSHNGELIATASGDATAKLFNAADGTFLRTFKGHTALVNCVDFSPNDSMIVTAGYDKMLKIWNVATGQLISSKTAAGEMSGVRYSPNGNYIAATSYDGEFALRHPRTGEILMSINPKLGIGVGVAFSPDGQYVACSFGNNASIIWHIGQISGVSHGTFTVTDCATKPQSGIKRQTETSTPKRMDLR